MLIVNKRYEKVSLCLSGLRETGRSRDPEWEQVEEAGLYVMPRGSLFTVSWKCPGEGSPSGAPAV